MYFQLFSGEQLGLRKVLHLHLSNTQAKQFTKHGTGQQRSRFVAENPQPIHGPPMMDKRVINTSRHLHSSCLSRCGPLQQVIFSSGQTFVAFYLCLISLPTNPLKNASLKTPLCSRRRPPCLKRQTPWRV